MNEDRQNRVWASDIELMLTVLDGVGVGPAAHWLADRGVSFGVICRVLQEPMRRRHAATASSGQLFFETGRDFKK